MEMKFFFDIYDSVMICDLITISIVLVFVFRHLKLNLKKIIRSVLHAVLIFALGTILNYALFTLSLDFKILGGINFPLSWLITMTLYIAFFSNIPTANRIIMGATMYVAVVSMIELGHYLGFLFSSTLQNGALQYVIYLGADVLILVFAVLMKHFSLSKYTDIPAVSAVLILINTVVMATVVFVCTKLMIADINTPKSMYCIFCGAEYILVISGYMMIWFHCKVRHDMTELEVENRLLDADKNMLMLSEKAIDDMRCLRHDIQNQYMIMRMFIESEQYKELNDYFYSMNFNEVIGKGPRLIECGNELLNSIINMEMMKASSKDVDFTVKINVLEDITIEKSDLCRILVNLIDNAIEAVERNNAYDMPVDCKINKTKDYLYICVRNGLGEAANDRKLLEMATSKSDSSRHGFGHRIVEKLVNKYQGHIKYSIENDEFVVEVMLGNTAVNEG